MTSIFRFEDGIFTLDQLNALESIGVEFHNRNLEIEREYDGKIKLIEAQRKEALARSQAEYAKQIAQALEVD